MTQRTRAILCTLWVTSTLLLAACSAAPVQPPVEVQMQAEAEAQAEQPTLELQTEQPAAQVEQPAAQAEQPADWTQTVTVEGDFYLLGNPAAPVRLVDFSDFF